MRAQQFDMPTGAELEELVRTSLLVPCEDVKTDTRIQMQSGTPATTAPSSAAPSPLLECVGDCTNEVWPSLREAVSGWDFCSEGSDTEDMWELPEPAMELDFQYVDLLENSPNKSESSTTPFNGAEASGTLDSARCSGTLSTTLKMSMAEVLRSRHDVTVQPPRFGTRLPPTDLTPQARETPSFIASSSDEKLSDHISNHRHGWTKQHKSSWNKKLQRKVAAKIEQRFQQSCKSRGWLPDGQENVECEA
jgi:hypothetical protein